MRDGKKFQNSLYSFPSSQLPPLPPFLCVSKVLVFVLFNISIEAAKLQSMPGKRSFDEQLLALEQLRQQDSKTVLAPLRKALEHKNNYVVGKAADLARDLSLSELIPELLLAFDRFFKDAIKTDPQCWAKNAIARALATFEHQDSAVFLRGMKHIQLEPVWGGRSDTAGALRGTCALALVQCRSVPEAELLRYLTDLFHDTDKSVRAEAARALEQVGSDSAALLLRLRALLGSDEPEVLGACYSGIVRIEGVKALPWMSRFLATADDSAGEAALAIAGHRSSEAFQILRKSFAEADDSWFRSVLLSAIALTRQQEAMDFLMDLVQTESLQAEAAIEAILRAMPSDEVIGRLRSIVANKPRLARALEKYTAESK